MSIEVIKHQDVIEKAKLGDEYAMQEIYALYAKAMLNTSFRIVNNREDAEDSLQESFVKAFSNLHQFKYQSTFGAWLKRIVVNKSIDTLKKRSSSIFFSVEDNEVVEEQDPLKNQDLKQKLDTVYTALHQLPDGYRAVASLYLLEGYDHEEIAGILNIGVSTSISQLSRAKKKLKLLIIETNRHERVGKAI